MTVAELAPAAPGDSLVRAPAVPPSDHGRRVARLLLVRTIVVTVVLGLSVWVLSRVEPTSRVEVWLQSAIIAATYVSSIVFGVLLRRKLAPQRVARPMLANDLVLTSALVYVTGGVLSPYAFLYALTIVSAGALLYRRGALVVAIASLAAYVAVALLAWRRVIDVPMSGEIQPWAQSGLELVRSLAITGAALVGVGTLAVIFGDQLQRGAETLATTRRAAGELLALHQDIVRSLSSGLVTLTPDGRVLTANHAAGEILRRPVGELVDKPLEAVIPGFAAALSGETRRADITIAAKGGDLTIGATVSPLRDARDQVIGRVINFQDLTELRRLEQHARRAERLATVGHLAAGVAHEIRNPLASISGSIELLRSSPQASEDDRTLMAIVQREVQRLNVLIGDLLDYANPRPAHPVDFDLGVMVDEVVQVARGDRAFEAVELTCSVDAPLPVHADPAKLRQVVWNLVRNAAEAAAGGGKHVRVEARTAGGDEARVAVEDDGPGMTEELLARVFEPFFTTKATGTGFGLATSHAVVAELGGRIDVDTAPGRGTRMVVTLPRVRVNA
ncbi:MAG TPA: ATP-binding protein [Kofleriaceae bacterium]|nr:ATP-binding protein [Kofleriaceae bacterium]